MLDPAKLPEPRNIEELTGHFAWHILNGKCPVAGGDTGNSAWSFEAHFLHCSNMEDWLARLFALALMELLESGGNRELSEMDVAWISAP